MDYKKYEILLDTNIWRCHIEVWKSLLCQLETLAQVKKIGKENIRYFLLSLSGKPVTTINADLTVMIMKLLQVLIGYPPNIESICTVFDTIVVNIPSSCFDQEKNTDYMNKSLNFLNFCTSSSIIKRPKDLSIGKLKRDHSFIEIGTSVSTDAEHYTQDFETIDEEFEELDSFSLPSTSTIKIELNRQHKDSTSSLVSSRPKSSSVNHLLSSLLDLIRSALSLLSSSDDQIISETIKMEPLVVMSGAECEKVRINAFKLLSQVADRASKQYRKDFHTKSHVLIAIHRVKYRGLTSLVEAESLLSSFSKLILSDFKIDDLDYLPTDYFPVVVDELRHQSIFALLVFVREICKNNTTYVADYGSVIDKSFILISVIFERSQILADCLLDAGITQTVSLAIQSKCSDKNNIKRCLVLLIAKCIYAENDLHMTFDDIFYTMCGDETSRELVYESIMEVLRYSLGSCVQELIGNIEFSSTKFHKIQTGKTIESDITARIFKLIRRSVNIPMYAIISDGTCDVEQKFIVMMFRILWFFCAKIQGVSPAPSVVEEQLSSLINLHSGKILELTKSLLQFLLSSRCALFVRIQILSIIHKNFNQLSFILKNKTDKIFYFTQSILYYHRAELSKSSHDIINDFCGDLKSLNDKYSCIFDETEIYDQIDLIMDSYDRHVKELAAFWNCKIVSCQNDVLNRIIRQYKTTETQVYEMLSIASLNLHTFKAKCSTSFEETFQLNRSVLEYWNNLVRIYTHENAILFDAEVWSETWEIDPVLNKFFERKRFRRYYGQPIEPKFYLANARSQKNKPRGQYLKIIQNLPLKPHSKEIKFRKSCVLHVLDRDVPGIYLQTDEDLTFIPDDEDLIYLRRSCLITDVLFAVKRCFSLKDTGFEMFLKSGMTMFLSFTMSYIRDEILKILPGSLSVLTTAWLSRKISNFEYLMGINLQSRSYHDLMQYPVFPYVLSNYSTETLDLLERANFRFLDTPISIQENCMKQKFKDRFEYLRSEYLSSDPPDKDYTPYHYSSLYSNSGIVLHFLVRVQPFTKLFLDYQDNAFDIPDRSFHSMETTYKLSSYASMTDVKELIPEFYYWSDFYQNSDFYDFGKRQNDQQVNHVALPAWAKNARIFSKILRQALESEIVSLSLHFWIDMIFGALQRPKPDTEYSDNEEIVKAVNVYHPATYSLGLTSSDELKAKAILDMVKTYGQIPKQIFMNFHEKRCDIETEINYGCFRGVKNIKLGNFFGSHSSKNVAYIQEKKYLGYKLSGIVDSGIALPENIVEIRDKLIIRDQNKGGCFWQFNKDDMYKDVRKNSVKYLDMGMEICYFSGTDEVICGYSNGRVNFGENILMGHENSIVRVAECKEQNLIVTLDDGGRMVFWTSNYEYVRSVETGRVKAENYLLNIFPTTGDVALTTYNSEKIKTALWSINASLEAARDLDSLQLHSSTVSDMTEGENVNVLYLGVSQQDNHAIVLLSSWDLSTLNIIEIKPEPLSIIFKGNDMIVSDEKNVYILNTEVKSERKAKLISDLRVLPFWLVNPSSSSSLKKFV